MATFSVEFDSTSKSFHRVPLTTPQLDPGEVLVRVTCCTLCGSDLHTVSGRRSGPERCVLGHEIVGKVLALGEEQPVVDYFQRPLQLGQRVTWTMPVGCGDCFYCNQQLSQKCESLFKYGHEPSGDKPTGGLSHYCVIAAGTPIFPLPDSLPDRVACPANCATATVAAALRLVEQTHEPRGATTLLVGMGMLGLTASAQLSVAGAGRIVAVDPDSNRLEIARSFGATACLQTADPAVVADYLASVTKGRGADIALDFAGMSSAVNTCLSSVRTGGCVLLAGSTFPDDAISLLPEQLVRRILTVRGLHNYLPMDLERGLRFLEENHARFPFAELVAKTFPLDEAQRAFAYAETHRPVRVAVIP